MVVPTGPIIIKNDQATDFFILFSFVIKRLNFSIVTVNLGDIAIQSVLLWKAYIFYDRSRKLLIAGSVPLFGILIFIVLNCTVGRSSTYFTAGVCTTFYRKYCIKHFLPLSEALNSSH